MATEIPETTTTTTGSFESPQWDWRMVYYDTGNYWRALAAGYNAGIHLQAGVNFPAGYRVANGQNGGGYPAAGAKTTGNEPIKMQATTSGSGRLKFVTSAKIMVKNSSGSTGSCAFGLGVCDVNGPNFPQWPYIGCGHDLDINALAPTTVPPGQTILIMSTRLDMVDNAFMAAKPIPTWPNWQMDPNSTNKLWPAVTPLFKNTGGVALQVGGVFIISWNC